MGRIGRLVTKSGIVETPAFMPVINPLKQSIPPRIMLEKFGCDIVITNSYIIMKNFGDEADIKIHSLLDYEGVIATDSGAYQLLVYGDIDTTSKEIIEFQQDIGSDIAVILDIPTGWNETRDRVEYTVQETLRRARESLSIIDGDKVLWVGPVQGGSHIDLVEYSAKEVGAMPFQIHALGSPTEVMENYQFTVLVDMIMAAKRNLPPDRPLHLFGAGHPMMFGLAVALGCDLFDSAAYALYAKAGRYLTTLGTMKLKDLRYLPCECPVCSEINAQDLKMTLKGERERLLAEHNLWVTMAEIRRVKQAIVEGTLWDLVEARSRSHPSMVSALKRLYNYREEIERTSPGYKGRGVFFFGHDSLSRPEIIRHVKRLKKSYSDLDSEKVLMLITAPRWRPYSKSNGFKDLLDEFNKKLGDTLDKLQISFFAAPFGVIPLELSETYPLSQFEMTEPLDIETVEHTSELVASYFKESSFSKVLIVLGNGNLDNAIKNRFEEIGNNSNKWVHILTTNDTWKKENRVRIVNALKRIFGV
jgi:7-cyano-7-deazaguanine tRNA-ribosyltransferase